jgi:WD40 repeat protein/serine/threonine protein kinase/tetratricopeptide (TPR) repeat protein
MSPCPPAELLERLIKDQLTGAEGDSVAAHVEGCASCQRTLEELTAAPAPSQPVVENRGGEAAARAQSDLDRLIDRRPTVIDSGLHGPHVGPSLRRGKDDAGLARADGFEAGTPAGTTPLPAVAGFKVVREVGRGGMGIVYEAIELALGRRVALKVLPPLSAGPNTVARFHREVRAAGRLHHTNIVPIYGVGQDGGLFYYAMQFIEGEGLDRLIARLRRDRAVPAQGRQATEADEPKDRPLTSSPSSTKAGPPPEESGRLTPSSGASGLAHSRTVARIGLQVAGALAYAHRSGFLHRDIKPSNILLDPAGTAWVADFGLAKGAEDEEALTQTGDIIGTIRYLPPERFDGHSDARGDVYSVGATLYELLTLRPVFEETDRSRLIERVLGTEPIPPRQIDRHIPNDLETVILKAIEKDPARRYATADQMAEDLRRFLADEPILARRASAVERYLRWARRHPAIAVLGGVLTAVLIGATIASVLVAGRMAALASVNKRAADSEHGARVAAQKAQTQAVLERQRAEHHLYIARIGQAESALRLFDSDTAQALLDQCRPEPGGSDRRGWEWFYLYQWCRPELRTISLPTTADTQAVAVSPDGQLLAVGCSQPYAWLSGEDPPAPAFVIGLRDGTVRHALDGHRSYVYAVSFRPDGRRLATLGAEGTIRVWDTGSGQELRAIGLGARVGLEYAGLQWSPDGQRLASAAGDGLVRIWDPETGQETARFAHLARSVAWSPDGTRIASGGDGLEVRPWDAGDGRLHDPILRQPGEVHSLSWSSDGRRLAAASRENDQGTLTHGLSVWDTTSGARVIRVGHVSEVRSVAFNRDGTRVATGGKDGIVRVIDAADGRERFTLFTGSTSVSGLALSPDGRRLYACGWRMEGVKVFDPARDPRGRGIPSWLDQLAALTFDRDGRRVLGVEWVAGALAAVDPFDGVVKVEQVLPVTDSIHWPRGDFAFSPDSLSLAAPMRKDGTAVGVWDVALGRPVKMLRGSGGLVTAVAFRPDGQTLATASARGPKGRTAVTLWDLASGRAIRTFESGEDPVLSLAFSGDGRQLAAGGGRRGGPGFVTVWDAETGAVLRTLDRLGPVTSLAFDRDGARLAVADYEEAKVHLWDLQAGTLITHPAPVAVSCVAFLPDGKRLAALGYDGNVHIADARTGDEVLVLRGFGSPLDSGGYTPRIAFSPDGSCIAGHYAISHMLNLWDLGPAASLVAEPDAGDLAGWLRRSRALAEQGDPASADAAYTRARMIEDGDPFPWIEHALALSHRGDARQARDALDRAMRSLPDDAGRWSDLGRLLKRFDLAKEAETALAKVRSLLERRLSRAPDDETAASALADVLPDAPESRMWTVLQPDVMTSTAGATLTRLPDGSVLADGIHPVADTYTLEATTGMAGITALRLEALPDPSLPHRGPGQDPQTGNFYLDEIRLSAASPTGGAVPVDLSRAYADFWDPRPGYSHVSGTLDRDTSGLWSIWPRTGQPHCAVFQTAEPMGTNAGTRLRVRLAFRSHAHALLGRFRLSVTNEPVPFFELRLIRLKDDSARNGLVRLGAAYSLLGDWASAAAVLERASAHHDGSAIDGFLLALAYHHLGQADKAQSECDRALARLRTDHAEHADADETRDVTAEALTAIRGWTISQAESLLLDAAFPANPFAQ